MMKILKRLRLSVLFMSIPITYLFTACNKFLSEKPDNSLAIPTTLKDLQALLDNDGALTWDFNTGEISSDDFYLTSSDWNSLSSEPHRRAYLWEKDFLFANKSPDWRAFSTTVYYCNAVLEGLKNITFNNNNLSQYNYIKGQAFFYRAKTILAASGLWCLAYGDATAATDLGLPLRQNTNFNEPTVRSTVRETYQQIISDLKKAIPLLPTTTISPMRPSRSAAYACLARTYLTMNMYLDAGLYADSCLQLTDKLLDYNSLVESSATYPFANLNTEVISFGGMDPGQILNLGRARVVDELYEQYDSDDLRKILFFSNNPDGTHGFKGRYTGNVFLFSGFATDEMYLIKSECLARDKRLEEAMSILNKLLVTRWRTDKFKPLVAVNDIEALDIILKERRKELLFRGLRWTDIKRLNKEGKNIIQKRIMDNNDHVLYPNDLRYALPIPEDIIEMSGIPQNPR